MNQKDVANVSIHFLFLLGKCNEKNILRKYQNLNNLFFQFTMAFLSSITKNLNKMLHVLYKKLNATSNRHLLVK